MQAPHDYIYDVASGLALGRRDRQEDAVAVDFPVGSAHGFAVLSDGMGGHDAGDIASRVVVTEVFSELKMKTHAPDQLERDIRQALYSAMHDANLCIDHVSSQMSDDTLMGATMLVPVLFDARLYWISVGDSPLFLFRDQTLTRLNETHSMAARFDEMHEQGLMDADEAANHPDRQCLTSVLAGRDIAKIDCSDAPFHLRPGDIVLAASDGVEFLSPDRIADVLTAHQHLQSAKISAALLREIETLDDPHQDNVSLCVIKLNPSDMAQDAPDAPKAADQAPASRSSVTVLTRKSDKGATVYCVSRKVTA